MNGNSYTVLELAELAGVSSRTLRYYDQIGLLKPARLSPAGYRLYGETQVNMLQHILFYREMDISLKEISGLIGKKPYMRLDLLRRHRVQLENRMRRLERILQTLDRTIRSVEQGETMSDEQKFEGFINEMIETNEAEYGGEARDRWGDQAVDAANLRLKKRSKAEFEDFERLSARVLESLGKAMDSGDPSGEAAMEAAGLHRQFLEFWWEEYSPEAHAGTVAMYLEDERFKAYYEKLRPGASEFLKITVLNYLEKVFDYLP